MASHIYKVHTKKKNIPNIKNYISNTKVLSGIEKNTFQIKINHKFKKYLI